MVLIETYWNVNVLAAEYEDHVLFVLIETYWNVNETEEAEAEGVSES